MQNAHPRLGNRTKSSQPSPILPSPDFISSQLPSLSLSRVLIITRGVNLAMVNENSWRARIVAASLR